MKNNLENYKKKNEFLLCVDSDGSVINTMTEKHKKCFAPQAVKNWDLSNIEEEFLKVWNKVNLFSATRGINRFKGLVRTFERLERAGFTLPSITKLKEWTEKTSELSNKSLLTEIRTTKDNNELKMALRWSKRVNNKISELEKKPENLFKGLKKILGEISNNADIAVVSSANNEALIDEWNFYDLSDYVKVILGQESGRKDSNISDLKEMGYKEDHILMIGDAPGDLKAARANKVLFYPILPQNENLFWKRLEEKYLSHFFDLSYQEKYQNKLIDEFKMYLNDESGDV